MTNPIRDSPRSSSSAAPMRATPAGLVLLLLALAGRTTYACSFKVYNFYNTSLTLDTYNSLDIICTVPYESSTVGGYNGGYGKPIGRPPRWVDLHFHRNPHPRPLFCSSFCSFLLVIQSDRRGRHRRIDGLQPRTRAEFLQS